MSGEVVEGGRWLREEHGYLSLPLMVRPNTILPVGASEARPDYDYADGVTYHVFELDESAVATAQVPALDGSIGSDAASATVEARRAGPQIEISVHGASKPWSVLLRGVEAIVSVEGGAVQAEALGTRVVPKAGISTVIVHLQVTT